MVSSKYPRGIRAYYPFHGQIIPGVDTLTFLAHQLYKWIQYPKLHCMYCLSFCCSFFRLCLCLGASQHIVLLPLQFLVALSRPCFDVGGMLCPLLLQLVGPYFDLVPVLVVHYGFVPMLVANKIQVSSKMYFGYVTCHPLKPRATNL